MKKVLIIGANGFVGRRILKHLTGKEYDLTAVSLHADIQPQPGYRFVEADVKQTDAIRQLILSVQPDAVINASALSVPDYCEQQHNEAYAMNVEATTVMAQACRACGARFLHLSTDFVFEGKKIACIRRKIQHNRSITMALPNGKERSVSKRSVPIMPSFALSLSMERHYPDNMVIFVSW